MYGKDMSLVYSKMDAKDLRVLRSKKVLKLDKIGGYNSYFAKRDRDALAHQIDQIDAELECRRLQLPLL